MLIFFNYSQTEPFSPSVPPFGITDCSITDSTRKKFSKGLTSEAIIIWEAIYESVVIACYPTEYFTQYCC